MFRRACHHQNITGLIPSNPFLDIVKSRPKSESFSFLSPKIWEYTAVAQLYAQFQWSLVKCKSPRRLLDISVFAQPNSRVNDKRRWTSSYRLLPRPDAFYRRALLCQESSTLHFYIFRPHLSLVSLSPFLVRETQKLKRPWSLQHC